MTTVTAEATSVPTTADLGGRATAGGTEEGRGRGAGVPRGGAGATRGASAPRGRGGTARAGRTTEPRGRSRPPGKDGELWCAWLQDSPPFSKRKLSSTVTHSARPSSPPPPPPFPDFAFSSSIRTIQNKNAPSLPFDLPAFRQDLPRREDDSLLPLIPIPCRIVFPPPPSFDLGLLKFKAKRKASHHIQQIRFATPKISRNEEVVGVLSLKSLKSLKARKTWRFRRGGRSLRRNARVGGQALHERASAKGRRERSQSSPSSRPRSSTARQDEKIDDCESAFAYCYTMRRGGD